MELFTPNRKTISEINQMFEAGELIIDDSYQRRSVWGEKDMVRLIETILLNLVVPELFFWKADTNAETGKSITHIVDGQQRINAISAFVNNKLKLSEKYLLDDQNKNQYKNKFFNDLSKDEKKTFWNYQLMVIDIDASLNQENIVSMFRRLNLTNYSLNDQEKRHSYAGLFADLVKEVSDDPFWDQWRLFSNADVKRMKDVEFCASIILLCKKGVIDQTSQKVLNDAYEDMKEKYDDKEVDKEKIMSAINCINKIFVHPEIILFAKKTSQLYTLFSVVFELLDEGKEMNDEYMQNLYNFIKLYTRIKKDYLVDHNECNEKKDIINWLNQYRLAASEGSRKYTNRMQRHIIMKKFIYDLSQKHKKIVAELLHEPCEELQMDSIMDEE